MGTRAPIDNKFISYRALQRKRVRKAKLARPSAESQTLTVRGKRYNTAKKIKKDDHRKSMIKRALKRSNEVQHRTKQIAQAKADGAMAD